MDSNKLFLFFMLVLTALATNQVRADGGMDADYFLEERFKTTLLMARKGDRIAQFKVATMYERGRGIESNPTAAFRWYVKSARQHNIKATYKVASMYRDGIGVEKDLLKAFRLMSHAAKKHYVRAQFYLGHMYEYGFGATPNAAKAKLWYSKAKEGGFEPAGGALKRLAKVGVKYAMVAKSNPPESKKVDKTASVPVEQVAKKATVPVTEKQDSAEKIELPEPHTVPVPLTGRQKLAALRLARLKLRQETQVKAPDKVQLVVTEDHTSSYEAEAPEYVPFAYEDVSENEEFGTEVEVATTDTVELDAEVEVTSTESNESDSGLFAAISRLFSPRAETVTAIAEDVSPEVDMASADVAETSFDVEKVSVETGESGAEVDVASTEADESPAEVEVTSTESNESDSGLFSAISRLFFPRAETVTAIAEDVSLEVDVASAEADESHAEVDVAGTETEESPNEAELASTEVEQSPAEENDSSAASEETIPVPDVPILATKLMLASLDAQEIEKQDIADLSHLNKTAANLLRREWNGDKGAARFLPSALTRCEGLSSTELKCVSGKLERKQGKWLVIYVTHSELYDVWADGNFRVSYRNQVLSVEQVEVQKGAFFEETQLVKTGWQKSKHELSCKLDMDSGQVGCSRDAVTFQHYTSTSVSRSVASGRR